MLGTIVIPLLFALVPLILLISVFVIPGFSLLVRWISILGSADSELNITGGMKVPTFYSSRSIVDDKDVAAYVIMMSVVGTVFGGIHCIGWFFIFPSNNEAMLWRVSSAVLTGITFLFPLLAFLLAVLPDWVGFYLPLPTIMLLVYVVSRLLLLVEAFISLRHLTPGMLALVKWTSFIPHI
jgi:hypothetical protein